MKRFYAVDNTYGSETSVGFANTWRVLAFQSKKARDEYVDESPDLGTKAIGRSEIGKYLEQPRLWSGDYWGITPEIDDNPAQVIVASAFSGYERLNK